MNVHIQNNSEFYVSQSYIMRPCITKKKERMKERKDVGEREGRKEGRKERRNNRSGENRSLAVPGSHLPETNNDILTPKRTLRNKT